MSRPFLALERFIERIFERPVNRLFHTRLQPVQLQRRLERAMETERRVGADRTYAPNRFRVQLHPDDLADFTSYQATLEDELAEELLARAHARGYALVDRPSVSLHANAAVTRGEVAVIAEVTDVRRGTLAAAEIDGGGSDPAAPAAGVLGVHTAVFEVPVRVAPPLGLTVREPGGAARHLRPQAGGLRIGRAPDNDLVLHDGRVSRHHGQLTARGGTWVYRDLGSTNGSFLNGVRVTEIALGPGDVLRLGDSVLTVEAPG
jgi:FhaA, N-terminal domain/FHA domain